MSSVATIPMPGDLVDLIGPAAEHVENRSLLLDKFAFHKIWGLGDIKANDAHKWSLLRIADRGPEEIAREARSRRSEATRLREKDKNPDKVARLTLEADFAQSLASSAKRSDDLAILRARHTRRFLGLFRSAYGDQAAITIGQLEGRLAINLANSLIPNAGICLDRLFGMPYIPGSAIKGVCRHVALEELKSSTGREREVLVKAVLAVFGASKNDFEPLRPARKKGDSEKPAGDLFPYLNVIAPLDQKGAVSFLPAYPANETKIVVDLTNVHYPAYYQHGQESDQQNEHPVPNHFPVVEVGAQFAFCLVLNGLNSDPTLLDHARRWLETALTVRGLGAKTSAGYGWFSVKPEVLDQLLAEEAREAAVAQKKSDEARATAEAEAKEAARKASLDPEAALAEELLALGDEAFANLAKQLADQDELRQRAFISLLRDHKEKRDRWKTWKKKKPEMASGISAVCQKLNLPPLP